MFGKYCTRFLVIGFVLWVLSDGIRVAPGFQGNFLPGPDTDETLTDTDHSQHNGEESPQTEGHSHEDTGEPGLQRQQKNSEFKEQTTHVVNTSREDIDSVRWLPDLKNDTLPLHDGDLVDEAGNHGNQNQQENQQQQGNQEHQQQRQENQQHQQQQQENQEHQQQQQENQEHQQQQENREHQQQQENQEHQQQQENHQHQQQQMTTEQSPTAETHTEEEKSRHNENTESVLNPGEVTDSQPVNVPIIDSGHESIVNSPDRSTSPTERPDIDSGQHNIQGFGTEKYGGEVDQTETYVNLPEVTNGLPVDSGPHEILPEGFGTEANHGEKVKQQTLDPAVIRNTEEVTYSPTEPNYIEPHTGSEQQGVITTPKPEPVYTEPHHELIPTEWIKVNPKAITDTNPLAGPTEEVPGEPNMGTSAPDVNNSATENVFTEQNLHITSIPMNITDAEHQNNGGEEIDNNNNNDNKHGDKNSGTGSSKSANIVRITPTTPKKGFFPNESNSSFVETTPSDSELMPSSSISLHPSTPGIPENTPGIPENTPGIPENTPGMNSNKDTTKPSIYSIILRSSETVGIPSTTRLFAKSSVTMTTSRIENTASSHHGTTIDEELLPSSSLPVVTSTPIVTSDISGSATKSSPTLQRSVSVNIHSSRASHSSTVMVQASPSVAYLPLTSDGLIINGDKKKTKTTRQPSSPPTSATRRRSSPATVTTQQQSGPQTSPTQQQSGPQTSPTQQQSGPLTSPTRQHSGPGTIPTRQHSGPGTISTRQHSGPGTVPTRQHSGPRTVPTRQHSGPGTIPTRQQSGASTIPTKQQSGLPTSHTRQHSIPGTVPTREHSAARTIPTRQHFGPSSGPLTTSTRLHSGPTRQHSSSVTVPTGQHSGSATIPTGQYSSAHRNRTTVSVQSNATTTHSDNRTRSTSSSAVTHSTVSVKTKNTKPDTNSGMKNPAKTTSAKPGEKHPENESTVNTPAPSTYQPTVFIQISLRMTLPEFCSQKHIFTTELVKVIDTQGKVLEEKQVVYLNMHPLRCEEISKPSEEHEKITEVKVDIYIKDSKGNADVELTESCATMIKPGFHKLESSQFKHQITKVELVPHPQYVETGHTAIPTKSKEMEPGITIAVVIASVGGVCCVTLLILQIIIHRRSGKRMKPYFPGTNRYSIRSLDSIALGVVPKSRPNSGFWNPGLEQEELPTSTEPSHPLGYNALSNFIRDSNEVDAEFETLPHPMPRLSCVPVGAEDKNRFANVIPYPHTRVKLKEIPDEENSTYINANYVTGYRCDHKAYIATQDPMKNTVNDFWRMIWEQQARVILMLTPMDELGQPRCSPYWPENDTANGRKNYGDYTVTLKKKDVTPEYTMSVLELKDIENNLLREIRHFWYTCWPIDGTPEPISFVKFVLDTRPHYEDSGATVVVHCSPGTGRTGSFIALDICMRSYESKRTVNVANVVHRVRQERAGAVQTKDQYQLIYKALNEYATVMSSPSVSANSSVVTLHNML